MLSFLVISCGIAINALFLQDGRHVKHAGKRDGQKTVVQFEIPRLKNERDVSHVASLKPKDDLNAKIRDVLKDNSTIVSDGFDGQDKVAANRVISAIQEGLQQLGYQPGEADGIAGPTTRAAIMAYEFDRGLLQTGIADREILEVIRGRKSEPQRKAKTELLLKNSSELVTALQKALTKLGYNTGSIDGVIGPMTRQRIRSFERDNKLEITGRVSGRLVSAITKASGRPLILANLD